MSWGCIKVPGRPPVWLLGFCLLPSRLRSQVGVWRMFICLMDSLWRAPIFLLGFPSLGHFLCQLFSCHEVLGVPRHLQLRTSCLLFWFGFFLHRWKMLYTSPELMKFHVWRKLFWNMNKKYQKTGPPPSRTAANYIPMLLRRVSEQPSRIIWLGSQRKWGISEFVQKDSRNVVKLCNEEFRTLVIQDISTSGSWWPCSAGGDRWPQSGHRLSVSGERCPTLQRMWENKSVWRILHS